jgi:hypothetical protein
MKVHRSEVFGQRLTAAMYTVEISREIGRISILWLLQIDQTYGVWCSARAVADSLQIRLPAEAVPR